MNKKIVPLKDLSKISKLNQSKGNIVVLCHGVFDLLHVGHIKHFQAAKKEGDILIVTLTPDNYVNKGPNRPAFTTQLRLEAIAALESVDFVAENNWPTAVKTISLIRPNIYFKGPDYKDMNDDITGNIRAEVQAITSVGGKVKYSTDMTFSSSNLLNTYSNLYSEVQKRFISSVDKQLETPILEDLFDKLKNLKVLLIGETIIDQYVFCEALGKSGKESVLVLRDFETEQYLGGTAAVANHLSDFCKTITLLTALGESGEHEEFVKEKLRNNVRANFLYKSNSPTIVKKRYVDNITKNKTLGVYSINDESLNSKDEKKFSKMLMKEIKKHDLVLVIDYGHGLISDSMAKTISKASSYMALNAQINAANRGYHTMDKYDKADCVIINESELRHELRSREKNLKSLMKVLAKNLQTQNVVVTRGTDGAILFNKKKNVFIECPAFASKIVDKVGAGDAMLALLSATLRAGYDEKFSLLIGSLAAAHTVESIGTGNSVNKETILRTVQHILK